MLLVRKGQFVLTGKGLLFKVAVSSSSFCTGNFFIQLKILMSTSKVLFLKAYKAAKTKTM